MVQREGKPVRAEVLWLVRWSDDGYDWWIVWDDTDGRKVPAAYRQKAEAERRRDEMVAEFPEVSYEVIVHEIHGAEGGGSE